MTVVKDRNSSGGGYWTKVVFSANGAASLAAWATPNAFPESAIHNWLRKPGELKWTRQALNNIGLRPCSRRMFPLITHEQNDPDRDRRLVSAASFSVAATIPAGTPPIA
jgi:hypothetical protein